MHHLEAEAVLRHPARRALLDAARHRPGLRMAEAAAALGLSFHTTAHHARTLQRNRYLHVVRTGRQLALFAAGSVPAPDHAALAALRGGRLDEVVDELTRAPEGLGVTELARRLGCAKSNAHRKLGTLVRHGMAERRPGGRYRATVQALALAPLVAAPAAPPAPSRRPTVDLRHSSVLGKPSAAA